MGPGVTGIVKERVGKPKTIDDGRPGGFYVPRFRNLSERNPKFIRAYGFEGSAGTQMFPGNAHSTPGFGAGYKKAVRDFAGAYISMGGFGEVLARYENQVDLDPDPDGQVGHSRRALQLQVRRQREEDVRGHGEHGPGDVRDGRVRDRQRRPARS